MTDVRTNYQTPPFVCSYMAGLIPRSSSSVLEPTPGLGNLVKAIKERGYYGCTAVVVTLKTQKQAVISVKNVEKL